MSKLIRSVLVLIFSGWAGSVFAGPITDTGTVDGIAVANADSAREGVEQPPVMTNTGQMAGRVIINPETGKLGGPPASVEPPELSIATQNRLSRSDKGLQIQHLPDGTMLMNLRGRFQNMSVVTLGQDGEAHLSCSHSVDQIGKVMAHSADLPIEQEAGGGEP
jgi:hypothetical protein